MSLSAPRPYCLTTLLPSCLLTPAPPHRHVHPDGIAQRVGAGRAARVAAPARAPPGLHARHVLADSHRGGRPDRRMPQGADRRGRSDAGPGGSAWSRPPAGSPAAACRRLAMLSCRTPLIARQGLTHSIASAEIAYGNARRLASRTQIVPLQSRRGAPIPPLETPRLSPPYPDNRSVQLHVGIGSIRVFQCMG